MDPLERIDELTVLVEGARAVPMSGNCMVNRNDLLSLLDDLRVELPTEIRRSQALLEERDKVIAAGRREAERIIVEGEAEHARLVSIAEVTVSAEHEAARILAEARAEAQARREETDEQIDTALANFEQMLQRTLGFVERNRGKIQALTEIGPYDQVEPEHKPMPAEW